LHVSFLWHQEWEAGRRRERELAGREIERLRGSVQTLTRAANPLGKLMDFLQEDVDSMQRELATWQRTNLELMAQLRMEHRCEAFVCSLYDCVVCCCHTVSPW
jgi:P2-related tail formation protein